MTCIVGFIDKKNKRIIIGGDSAESNGLNLTIRKDLKVFENGDFIFGCTTSYRMIQLLQYSFNPPENIYKTDVFKYMCIDFIPSLFRCFKAGGFLQKDKNGVEIGGTFLVGYKDRLFKIQDDFQVSENIYGFDACGSGQDFALGSLYTSSSEKNAEKRVLMALEAAEYLSIGVKRPFALIYSNYNHNTK